MLENTVVFMLSNAKYDAPIESTGYAVAKHLAKKNKVFYIEYPATIKDYFQLKKSPGFDKKKALFKKSSNGLITTEIPNLKIVVLPLLLSINFIGECYLYRKLLAYNENIIISRLKNIIKLFNVKDYVYINSFNIHYPNIGKLLDAKLNVYHCVDPIVQNYDARHGHISEEIILKNSDLIICTSKELYRNKAEKHTNTYFIPNAADFDHSFKATLANTPIYSQIESIKKPVIGYFGNIEARMDYKLLKDLMQNNSDKSFVFVGPISPEFKKMLYANTNNLYFADPVPYEKMPSVLKGFDVAIIPFRKDNVSHTIFPLKLFEYLGSGKPVVATDFNTDLQDFTNGSVPFCKDEKEFSNAINQALLNDTPEKRELRFRVAKENTWDRRLDEFSEILNNDLRLKQDKLT